MRKAIGNLIFKVHQILVVVILTITISGCGVNAHPDAPKIKFVGAKLDENGVSIFTHPKIETKIKLDKPEGRAVFLEVLNNDEFQRGNVQGLVTGDDWGGKRFIGQSNSVGITTFNLGASGYGFYNFGAGQKYWVRSGVRVGQRDFGLLVSLIEMPIDRRNGHLFDTVTSKGEAIRVVFGVSNFEPFSVAN